MSTIQLNPDKLCFTREMNSRLISYNIEMTEVTGGTFWKPYTPEQVSGMEQFPEITDVAEIAELLASFPPTNLYDSRLRELAKALGPVYIRVSGTWASNTYYDFDGHTGGKPPKGFQSVLTEEQWKGVLDFVKYVDAQLMISVANCDGVQNPDGTWNPEQAKLIFDYSRDYGVPIAAAEFMNEPSTALMSGSPSNYSAEAFCRDQDAFYRFIHENYPEVLIVGPCASGDNFSKHIHYGRMTFWPSEEILKSCKEKPDVFSYHMYHGISERGASMGKHWSSEEAASEEYLGVPYEAALYYGKLRDRYCPGNEMWVTESADAGCGGDTWASTFLDVIRSADELGRFCTTTNGVIFHNTLMASDYAYLDRESHLPRPNYWLALLWNKLVGAKVYSTGIEIQEGLHCYAHSRKDQKNGYVYILINNSRTNCTIVNLPKETCRYTLSAKTIRSGEALLNGVPLEISGTAVLPDLKGETIAAGQFELAPATVTFLVMDE